MIADIKALDSAIANDKERLEKLGKQISDNTRKREALFAALTDEERQQLSVEEQPK